MAKRVSSVLSAVLCAPLVLLGGTPISASAASRNIIIGLPQVWSSSPDPILTLVNRLVFGSEAQGGLRPGDTLRIKEAPTQKTIITVEIPNDPAYEVPNYRIRQFKSKIERFKTEVRQSAGASSGLSQKNSQLLLPQFLTDIGKTVLPAISESRVEILLFGSALFDDPRWEGFSMREGAWPSDGLLVADSTKSPFSTLGKRLEGARITFCTTETAADWKSDLQKERVERMWSIFLTEQGAQMINFSSDTIPCLENFIGNRGDNTRNFTINHSERPVMYKFKPKGSPLVENASGLPTPASTPTPSNNIPDWLKSGAQLSSSAPSKAKGRVKIGIRWPCTNADIDLYARSSTGKPFVFYGFTATDDATYPRDFRSSPDAEGKFEVIEFTKEVEFAKIESFINFYAGSCPAGANGIVRAQIEGTERPYEMPFALEAKTGNGGRFSNGVFSPPYWVKIDMRQLFKINSRASPR